MRMSRGQPTMPWSDGLCQGQRYPSHREGGWMVIAVWLTLNVSADATGLLEPPGPRPVDAGRGYRPVSHGMRRAPPAVSDAPRIDEQFGSAWRGVSVSPMARSDSSARSRSTNAPIVSVRDKRNHEHHVESVIPVT